MNHNSSLAFIAILWNTEVSKVALATIASGAAESLFYQKFSFTLCPTNSIIKYALELLKTIRDMIEVEESDIKIIAII